MLFQFATHGLYRISTKPSCCSCGKSSSLRGLHFSENARTYLALRKSYGRSLLMRIPDHNGHAFHGKLDSHSRASWTLIPRQTGQCFQRKPDRRSKTRDNRGTLNDLYRGATWPTTGYPCARSPKPCDCITNAVAPNEKSPAPSAHRPRLLANTFAAPKRRGFAFRCLPLLMSLTVRNDWFPPLCC